MYVSPRCEDDGDMLGLGAAGSLAVLGAKAAAHHGRRIFWAYCEAAEGYVWYVGRYVGLV